MTQPLDRVRRLVSDVFNAPLESVSEDSSPDTVENWDSLQQLNLVLALEQEFAIQLDPEEIEALTDVRAIVAIVAAKTPGD